MTYFTSETARSLIPLKGNLHQDKIKNMSLILNKLKEIIKGLPQNEIVLFIIHNYLIIQLSDSHFLQSNSIAQQVLQSAYLKIHLFLQFPRKYYVDNVR